MIVDPVQTPLIIERRGDDVDLLERIIQRIFRAGMHLRGAMAGAGTLCAANIEEATSELDDVLRDIRAAMFAVAPIEDELRRFSPLVAPSLDLRGD